MRANSVPLIENHQLRRYGFYPNRFTLFLFYLFAANTVAPLFDVPLLGLSVTAVFFGLAALEILFRSSYLSMRFHARWILPVFAIGLGIFLSIFANGLLGNLTVDTAKLVALIQAAYWLIVCIVTMALVSNLKPEDLRILIFVLGVSIITVGAMRLYEAIAFDRIGPGTSRVFTQNAYGILFSTFTPFALILFFLVRALNVRFLIISGLLMLLIGIAVNGSRSSWVAAGIGIAVLSVSFLIAQRRRLTSFTGLIAGFAFLGVAVLSILPAEILAPISERFATLERVEEDKSFATRMLMQRKALTLFQENPLFGVGRGEFSNSYVELDFSDTPLNPLTARDFNRTSSHNSYAQFIAEQGLFGIIPLAILLALLAINGARAAIRLARAGDVWALAAFSSLIAMSVHMGTINNLQTTGSWFLYGLVAGMIEHERRNRVANRPGNL